MFLLNSESSLKRNSQVPNFRVNWVYKKMKVDDRYWESVLGTKNKKWWAKKGNVTVVPLSQHFESLGRYDAYLQHKIVLLWELRLRNKSTHDKKIFACTCVWQLPLAKPKRVTPVAQRILTLVSHMRTLPETWFCSVFEESSWCMNGGIDTWEVTIFPSYVTGTQKNQCSILWDCS